MRGDETTKPEPVLDGFDCSNLELMLHESALGCGTVEQSTDEPWIVPVSTRVSGHIHIDRGAGTERPGQETESSGTFMEFGRLCGGCDLLRRRCGPGSSVGCCCGGGDGRSDRKIERSGSYSRSRENTLENHPKMMDASIGVDGLAVLWEEVLEICGIERVLDGNARPAVALRSAQANKYLAKWRTVLNSSWLPRKLRLSIVNSTVWQAFLWSSSV